MKGNRKEEIVMTTLELAAEKGLSNVSMGMIAEKIGIKKPSLYKHFASKEEIIEAMYQMLRKQAMEKANVGSMDYGQLFAGKTAFEILQTMVQGYMQMNKQEQMVHFYKIIYAERSIQPMAAKIMAEETEKMIFATKQVFYAMEIHGKLHFQNPDMSAVSFAMTVHGLMEYALDQDLGRYPDECRKQDPGGNQTTDGNQDLLEEYLRWFCNENSVTN